VIDVRSSRLLVFAVMVTGCGSSPTIEVSNDPDSTPIESDTGADTEVVTPQDSSPGEDTSTDSASTDVDVDSATGASDSGSSGDSEPDVADSALAPETSATDDTGGASDTGSDTEGASDTTSTDTAVDDTTVADTYVPDTHVADTFVADTFVADTASVAATCSVVVITGYADPHVRQGVGTLALTAFGSGMSSVTSASLGSGIGCTITSTAADRVTLTCSVAHGAALGSRDLVLGGAVCPAAMIIDKITVAAANPSASDGSNGTSASPFRSIAKGLSVAAAGDTVSIAANGTSGYGAATGDTYVAASTDDPFASAPNVAAGVTVEGDPSSGTVLAVPTAAIGLRFGGAATISNVSIVGGKWGIVADSGNVSLSSTSVSGALSAGLRVGSSGSGSVSVTATAAAPGAGATPSACRFTQSGAGIVLTGTNAHLTATNCDVTANLSVGAHVTGGAELTTLATRISNSGISTALSLTPEGQRPGIFLQGPSKLTMTGGVVAFNYSQGRGH